MTDAVSPEDRDMLAAGLALGFLESEERAEALRLQLRDPDFARLVAQWQSQADRWLESVEPEPVEPSSWEGISDAVFGAQDNARDTQRSSNQGNWRGLALTASAASILLAAGLMVTLLSEPTTRPAAGEPQVAADAGSENVAQIADRDGAPLLSAIYSPDMGTLSLRVADFEQPTMAPELWVIDPEGVPHSLGLIESTAITIALSPELRELLIDGATMAITLEPRDGLAPHDTPTGEILGTATLQSLTDKSTI